MISSASSQSVSLYRVEVSGWDENKAFFVENADLEWSEGLGKRVTLRGRLRDRAVVFLRLLQPISADRGHPVAYEAESLGKTPDGNNLFHLLPLSRRCNTPDQPM